MTKKWVGILNPAAGGGRCSDRAQAPLARLRASGIELDIVTTSSPGHASELAANAYRSGVRDIVCIGGDGTTYEVVNGVAPLSAGDPARIGFLPVGTGNSFLRDFSTNTLDHALDALLASKHRPCDLVHMHHTNAQGDADLYSINILSLGFVADVGGTTNRRFKRLGELGYVFGVVSEVATLQPAPLPYGLDGGEITAKPLTFVSFNNSQFTGGKMQMAPSAKMDDGLIEVIHVDAMTRRTLLATFPKIFKGTHVAHPDIHVSQARTVAFNITHEVDVLVDGEVLTTRPLALSVASDRIEVYA